MVLSAVGSEHVSPATQGMARPCGFNTRKWGSFPACIRTRNGGLLVQATRFLEFLMDQKIAGGWRSATSEGLTLAL